MSDPLQLDQYKKRMEQQLQAEHLMMQALQAALQNPHTTVRLERCGIALEWTEHGELVMHLATENGVRYDVALQQAARRQILAAIQKDPDGSLGTNGTDSPAG